MQMATRNDEAKINWVKTFYPYSQYKISSDKLILAGANTDVDPTLLMRKVVNETIQPTGQVGGSTKEIKKFRINANSVKLGFEKLEKKVDEYFRKNNLDNNNKNFILSLKSLDGKKIFIKKY